VDSADDDADHPQLMLAFYRCGCQAEALAAYQDARQVLIDELGTEPGPELRQLHQQVLSADPALAAPEPAPEPNGHLHLHLHREQMPPNRANCPRGWRALPGGPANCSH
jgi:DNA-binding SARP family transcriptional activator